MTDSLTTAAARDGFTTESPIRAFTEFRVDGMYAIGKGFRPSMAHLTAYLTAMQEREAWMMVQIIQADNPSVVFRRTMPPLMLLDTQRIEPMDPGLQFLTTPAADLGAPHDEVLLIGVRSNAQREYECSGVYTKGAWWIVTRITGDDKELEPLRGQPTYWRKTGSNPVLGDPINPAHYDGTACADIGELLTPNAYQVLNYVWRLGKKDDVCIELGKALWYARREVALIRDGGTVLLSIHRDEAWFESRIADRSDFTKSIARGLWRGYNAGMDIDSMRRIGRDLKTEKARIECGPGSAL